MQKGMPYLAYQGRTGVIWNVTPRAVGVELNKQVRMSPLRPFSGGGGRLGDEPRGHSLSVVFHTGKP